MVGEAIEVLAGEVLGIHKAGNQNKCVEAIFAPSLRLRSFAQTTSGATRPQPALTHGRGVARLCDLPAEWSRQRQMLGLAAL